MAEASLPDYAGAQRDPGTAIAAMMPMIATTINSSMSKEAFIVAHRHGVLESFLFEKVKRAFLANVPMTRWSNCSARVHVWAHRSKPFIRCLLQCLTFLKVSSNELQLTLRTSQSGFERRTRPWGSSLSGTKKRHGP